MANALQLIGGSVLKDLESHTKERKVIRITDIARKESNMTNEVQKIKEWISKEQDGLIDAQGNFEYPEHERAYHILCNLDAYIDSMQEESVSMWHDSGEMPQEKKVCLIRYSANDGASTNNFEVVIAEPFTRRFVTRSYPHKTGYQHTIHGENTIKVDEYQDRREYIPFSDIDEWAYIDDLLNKNYEKRGCYKISSAALS